MNRKERRVAAHKELKLARKAGFPVATTPKSQPEEALVQALKTVSQALFGSSTTANAEPPRSALPALTVELQPSRNVTLSIAPGSPALRGAKLDLEITKITLTPR